ncbi:hypothetical protein VYU27_006683 [Nannochloropsis oceanica]
MDTPAATSLPSFLSYLRMAWIVIAVALIFILAYLWSLNLCARLCSNYIPGEEAGHLLSSDGANIPIIHAFLVVKGHITAADMAQVLNQAGIPEKRFQRLKHCISAEPGHLKPFDRKRGDWPVYWYPEPSFRPENHVRNLPDGLSRVELKNYLSSIVNTPPSFSVSPWEILVANALDGNDERTALVLRLHHVLGDGLSVLRLLEAISEPVQGEQETEEEGKRGNRKDSMLAAALKVGVKHRHHHRPHEKRHHHPSHHDSHNEATDPTTPPRGPGPAGPLRRFSPFPLVRSLLFYARMSIELPYVVYLEFLAPRPEQNLFKPRPLTGHKNIAWRVGHADVARVKRIKDALGAKLNDVLLACVTGALRTIMLAHGGGEKKDEGRSSGGGTIEAKSTEKCEEEIIEQHGQQDQQHATSPSSSVSSSFSSTPTLHSCSLARPVADTTRFFAPMSTRTNLASLQDLDNQLTVLSIPLPTGLASRRRRLAHIHHFTARLKNSTFPLGMALLSRIATSCLPARLLEMQNDFLCEKASGVLTNVPGPVHFRQMGGAEIEEIAVFVPAVSSVGMTLATFTYGQMLSLGLVLDQAVPCAAEEVLDAFMHELDAYEAMVGEGGSAKREGKEGER